MGMFGIGLSALQTAQKIEDMLSHNIANAETPGFKKFVEHNSEAIYGKQLAGVKTEIVRSGNPFLDMRLTNALADAAESDAVNEGMKLLNDNVKTKNVEEAFSAFMVASHNLTFTPNDLSTQATFKEAGTEFGKQMKLLGDQFTWSSQQITMKRDATQMQLEELQRELSKLTAGPATEATRTEVENLTKQVAMAARSVSGYNKVLSGVIPPIASMYVNARDVAVNGINASYGQSIIDTDGNFTFDPTNIGNAAALTEFGNQQFNTEMGQLNTVLGMKTNSFATDDTFYQNLLAGVQADVKEQTGVDIVAETMRVKQYQRMYEAAAQIIKTQDEMIGTILNIRS